LPEHLDRRRPTEAEAREVGRLEGTLDSLARDTSRRGFLARVGGALMAATAGSMVAKAVKPGEADAFHFCGHTFTTGSCPHPNGNHAPRIDSDGFPLSPDGKPINDHGRLVDREGKPVDRHGKPVDNLGRSINGSGEPINDQGKVQTDPDGRPLPPAPRTKLGPRTRVCDRAGHRYSFKGYIDGGWFRCCGGHVRKLVDCCAYRGRRINGDAALTGYCFHGRKVFCVQYFQTKVPC
jgi:hypothetical protein